MEKSTINKLFKLRFYSFSIKITGGYGQRTKLLITPALNPIPAY